MNSFHKRSQSLAGQKICLRPNNRLIKPRSRFTTNNQFPSHSFKSGATREFGNHQEKSIRILSKRKAVLKKHSEPKNTKTNKPKRKLTKGKKKTTKAKCLGKKNSKNKKRTIKKTNNVDKVGEEPKKEPEKMTHYPFLFNEKYESIPIRTASETQLKVNTNVIQDNNSQKPNKKRLLKRNSGTYKKMPFIPERKVRRRQSMSGIKASRKKNTKIKTMIESIF